MIVLGIDPGIACGKPFAMVVVELGDNLRPEVLHWAEGVVEGKSQWGRVGEWHEKFKHMVIIACSEDIDLVAVEAARGVGGRGAHLQCLVNFICCWAEAQGIPAVKVNPQTVKSAVRIVGQKGPMTAKRVAENVQSMVWKAEELPETKGYDYEAAVAVAIAGEGKVA